MTEVGGGRASLDTGLSASERQRRFQHKGLRCSSEATPAAGAAGSGAAAQSEHVRLLRCEIEDRAGALQPIVAAHVGDEMNLPVHLPADADVPEIEKSAFRV